MQFEIIFITEGRDSAPAAEIQFNSQRLCIVRFSPPGTPQIEFVQDLYVGRSTKMVFSLANFQDTVRLAVDGLAVWRRNLAERGPEA